MKRYAVFAFQDDSPGGGMNDFIFQSQNYDECIKYAENHNKTAGRKDWYEIWDMDKITKLKII